MKKEMLGVILISFAAVLWGLDGVVLTPRLFNLDIGLVVFLLHMIPFSIMSVVLYREYRHLLKFTPYDYVIFFLIAFFGGSLGTLAIVKALFLVQFESLSVVVLLQKLQPVFAIVLAAVLLKEKLKPHFLIWAGIAVIASYFLAFQLKSPNFNMAHAQAVIWALIAAFSFGSATVFGKMALKRHIFVTANFYRFGFTSFLMLIYTVFTGAISGISSVTPANWLIFLIIAFTTGSGAILIYYYGLRYVPASVSIICELFFPVSAVIFDFFINGKVLSLVQIASACIMVISIIQISRYEVS